MAALFFRPLAPETRFVDLVAEERFQVVLCNGRLATVLGAQMQGLRVIGYQVQPDGAAASYYALPRDLTRLPDPAPVRSEPFLVYRAFGTGEADEPCWHVFGRDGVTISSHTTQAGADAVLAALRGAP